MTRAWLKIVILGLCLVAARTGRAEDPSEARAHFDRATSAFALGRFNDAALEYEKAFELQPEPALLYNAAQSHRRAGNKHRALLLYQNYLRVYGRQPNRAEVARTIAELKQAILLDGTTEDPPQVAASPKEKPPEPVPGVATPAPDTTPAVTLAAGPPAPRKPLVKKGWFWGVIVGSAVVVGGAVALGVVFGSAQHDPNATLGALKVNN